MIALLTGMVQAGGHLASLHQATKAAHRMTRHVRSKTSWSDHDRAVYAVSTLNAPLCSSHAQLSTVLWNTYLAREFDVLQATNIRHLFFIQVRTASSSLLGVYSYVFGTKLPTGVQSAHCVVPAGDQMATAYRNHAWKFVSRFTSTYPKN